MKILVCKSLKNFLQIYNELTNKKNKLNYINPI